jgi:hypothetical protein
VADRIDAAYALRAVTRPISILAISAVICAMLRRGDDLGAALLTFMNVAMIGDASSSRSVRSRMAHDRAAEIARRA